MGGLWRRRLDPALYPPGIEVNPSEPALSWSAIIAGASAAIALTIVLMTIGAAFSLLAVAPWPGTGAPVKTFSVTAGIWLIVTQWLSSAVGGYLTGRMRTRWHSLHDHEVFFRDTAHGLVAWSVATILVAFIAVSVTAITSLATSAAVEVSVTPEAAEIARKALASAALFTGISMLIGAFIACVSAAIGGELRDRHP